MIDVKLTALERQRDSYDDTRRMALPPRDNVFARKPYVPGDGDTHASNLRTGSQDFKKCESKGYRT